MKEFSYVITNELGLHARPAGQLVRMTAGFACDVKLTVNEKTVDAKGIMGVMSLGAKKGQEMTITCEGVDETEAVSALEPFVKANF